MFSPPTTDTTCTVPRWGYREDCVAAQRSNSDDRTVYVDVNPLAGRHLTGIGRYTARLALALAATGPVRFFSMRQEVFPPAGLSWDHDQDLGHLGRRLWRGRRRPLGEVPPDSLGLYGCFRPLERIFPIELSILYDFTPLIVPHTHSARTRAAFQEFFAHTLLSSDGALAISHSTKADAAWLCDLPQNRIRVAHPGPSLCVGRHLDAQPLQRLENVMLVVSTLEPRKNAFFLLEWFRDTHALPPNAELWWVGPLGWLTARRRLKAYRNLEGRKVRFLGVVSDAALCRLYRTAWCTVYPSLYEGFGFPVLDSLRHGTPALVSYNSSLRELAHTGVHFIDPLDPKSLDRAVRAMRESEREVAAVPALDEIYRWDGVAHAVRDFPDHHALNAAPAKRRVA
jgi:glycosyltransferase involved in cell wall biosynthesis